MRAAGAALIALGALAGCGGSSGSSHAIVLAVRYGGDVPDSTIAASRDMDVQVSGAEQYSTQVPVSGQFAGHATATVRYKPGVASGLDRKSVV